jgi:hypothetical protein
MGDHMRYFYLVGALAFCPTACLLSTPSDPTSGNTSRNTSENTDESTITWSSGECDGGEHPIGAGSECTTDAPLGCSCSRFSGWLGNGTRASDFSTALDGEGCLGLSFLETVYIIGLDLPGGDRDGGYFAYRCGTDDEQYDVVVSSATDMGRPDGSAYFDASGVFYAYKESDREHSECWSIVWGSPVLPCAGRYNYTMEDIQTLLGSYP